MAILTFFSGGYIVKNCTYLHSLHIFAQSTQLPFLKQIFDTIKGFLTELMAIDIDVGYLFLWMSIERKNYTYLHGLHIFVQSFNITLWSNQFFVLIHFRWNSSPAPEFLRVLRVELQVRISWIYNLCYIYISAYK